MAACAFMMAHHVAGKAVRDALFLSSFDVTSLPRMVIAASGFSILSVVASSRAMTRFTPARLVPIAFASSALLFLLIWTQLDHFPRVCAVLVYLLIVGLGSLLTSGFWSMINERFDPRTAKRYIGRIAGAGTLGGIIGGALAERIAAIYSLPLMLPVLAAYHLSCALLLRGMSPPLEAKRSFEESTMELTPERSGWRILQQAPYLRTLAILVLLGTMSAGMIDYVFKAQAVSFYGRGDNLLRFFAVFYGVVGVLSFFVQTGFSGISLSRLGLAKTVGTLPFAVSGGGLAALVMPGLISATLARAMEAVFRGSLFRAGYEIFYTPMPKPEKRAAKPIVDVGFDRLGDALGSGVVTLLLGLGAAYSNPAILTGAIIVGLGGLWMATRLQSAYIGALEHGLRERGEALDLVEAPDALGMSGVFDSFVLPASSLQTREPRGETEPSTTPEQIPSPVSGISVSILSDPVLAEIAELRSGDLDRVRGILARIEPVPPYLVPHLIQLLAWDQVYTDVTQILRRCADRHAGQLSDALTDKNVDFTIRRRLPRVLSVCQSARAAEGLALGLSDRRFEVRFQSGRALTAIKARQPKLRISEKRIFEAIRREVTVSRAVWESQRLLDRAEDNEGPPFVDEFLRTRTSRSLQHVFTLLALVLPAEPLKIAFHGLHTEDHHLRGTALEYLDSILPPDIRGRLWPLLEKSDAAPAVGDSRPREELLAELMKSNQSIQISLEQMRRKAEESAE
jgi:AAA family ATP:ADP antiporter